MKISDSLNDQLMVMAAHRYCLGRRSYIVSCCIEWISQHWDQFESNTKANLIRDTIEAIATDCAGSDIDLRSWKELVMRLYPSLYPNQITWLKQQLQHRDDYKICLEEIENNAIQTVS